MNDNFKEEIELCASCGSKLNGRYCSNCGEKVNDPGDLSFLKFITQALDIFSNFDSKFLRSFWFLITRPGYLTLEYLSGRRINYRRPLQFFLVLNVLYFIFQPYTTLNIFNTNLDSHISQQMYSQIAEGMVKQKITAENISYTDYSIKFNSAIDKLSKSLIILNIPVYALIVFALGRKRRKFYGESIVFSVHIYSFILIINITVLLIIRAVDPGLVNNDTFLTILMFIIIFLYIFASLKRAFFLNRTRLAVSSFILTVSFFAILALYRLVLFFITFYYV